MRIYGKYILSKRNFFITKIVLNSIKIVFLYDKELIRILTIDCLIGVAGNNYKKPKIVFIKNTTVAVSPLAHVMAKN